MILNHLIEIYIFFLPVILPSMVPRLATESAVRLFPGVWKLISLLRLLSRDRVPSQPLFIFYIFSYVLLETMGCFLGCLMSFAGIQ